MRKYCQDPNAGAATALNSVGMTCKMATGMTNCGIVCQLPRVCVLRIESSLSIFQPAISKVRPRRLRLPADRATRAPKQRRKLPEHIASWIEKIIAREWHSSRLGDKQLSTSCTHGSVPYYYANRWHYGSEPGNQETDHFAPAC